MTTRRAPRNAATTNVAEHIELVERTTAHNYHPLPSSLQSEGCWVTDVERGTSTCWPRTRP